MKFEFDGKNVPNDPPPATIDVFVRNEHQYSQPTARADGVSFPAIPTSRGFRFAVSSGITAFGTKSLTAQPVDMTRLQSFTIVLPAVSQPKKATAAERYARLKDEIVASGVPLLNDEDLRAEIQERKGVKGEPES